jgi:hypothetical protein
MSGKAVMPRSKKAATPKPLSQSSVESCKTANKQKRYSDPGGMTNTGSGRQTPPAHHVSVLTG